MAADEAREVTLAWQKIHFLEKVDGLGIVAADALGVAIHFLRERDADAEVSSLGELGQLERLEFSHAPGFHAGRLKMRFGAGRVGAPWGRDIFTIVQQVLFHPDVFAAHRTVSDRPAALFRD
jgi:hypothetical protein